MRISGVVKGSPVTRIYSLGIVNARTKFHAIPSDSSLRFFRLDPPGPNTGCDAYSCLTLCGKTERAQSLSDQSAAPTPHLRAVPRCSTTSRLIVQHYLAVPCLSFGISARGPTRDLRRHVPGWGVTPAFCLAASLGQAGVCSRGACSI